MLFGRRWHAIQSWFDSLSGERECPKFPVKNHSVVRVSVPNYEVYFNFGLELSIIEYL